MKAITVAFESVTLIEMNRGKAGALNFCNSYLRAKTNSWRNILNDPDATQTFVGIVDARHALVEPNIFWNDALPFFSIEKDSGRPVRKYGFGNAHDYPVCITVQYPQYFSNVGTDDYLDNANTAYYNMWQPLRDCAKCITSSGTNTVWYVFLLRRCNRCLFIYFILLIFIGIFHHPIFCFAQHPEVRIWVHLMSIFPSQLQFISVLMLHMGLQRKRKTIWRPYIVGLQDHWSYFGHHYLT